MARGRFITLEGGEGVGKSTQLRTLACILRERGIEVIETREPGGSDGAELIRDLLLSGGEDKWRPRAEALLFAAARSDHVEKLIRPALEGGKWVLCDRFLDSSRAYQSGASGLADAEILALHKVGSEGLLPDRTLVLMLPIEEAENRASARDGAASDRFGARGRDFHAAVDMAFRRYAVEDPERMRMIDASGSPEVVATRLIAEISDLLP